MLESSVSLKAKHDAIASVRNWLGLKFTEIKGIDRATGHGGVIVLYKIPDLAVDQLNICRRDGYSNTCSHITISFTNSYCFINVLCVNIYFVSNMRTHSIQLISIKFILGFNPR